MKPAFALDFRDGAVALLHRTARGWMSVGQTEFGSPDMDEALAFLRSTALGLSPGGVATKLIIPNDQILYLSVHAPGPDAAKRRKQIAAALEGRTPYAVADLVFDWWGKGDEVNVAVIARETLAEAEGFAHAHRFNPLSFVAVPDNGIFQSEPWFGQTSVAPQILLAGEKVDRDQDPVQIIGRDAQPASETAQPRDLVDTAFDVAPAEPTPSTDLAETPEPADEPEAPAVQDAPEPAAEPVLTATPEAPAGLAPLEDLPAPPVMAEEWAPERPPVRAPERASEQAPVSRPDPDLIASLSPEPALPRASEAAALPEFDAPPPQTALAGDSAGTANPAPFAEPSRFDDEAPQPVSAGLGETEPLEADEAPMAFDVADEAAMASPALPSASRPAPPQPQPKPKPEPQGFSLLRAFTSRRKAPSAPPPLKAEPGLAKAAGATAPEAAGTAMARIVPVAAPSVTAPVFDPLPDMPPSAAPESAGMAVIGAAVARPAAPKLSAERPALARPLPTVSAKGAAKTAKGLKGFGSYVTSPNINGPKKPRVATPSQAPGASPSANPSGVSPARPGTRPIGLGARPLPQRGKPRFLGLILTGILLVLLALVAAWSTWFLAFNTDETATSAVAGLEQPAEAEAGDVPAPEDEMLADLQDPADFTEAESEAAEPTDELALIESTAINPATGEAAPQTGLVSETGAASVTPAGDAQDEIFLAAIDTPPDPPDPSALGVPEARADALPNPAVPPPPFGTVYQFDADGRIVPTPEGIATPEGVLLVAGKPPVVPASRSAAVLTAVAASLPAAAAPEAGATTDAAGNPSTLGTDPAATPVFADPALKDFRPQRRPETLQVPSQTGATEDPALAPGTDSRFASLRPQKRTPAVVALATPPVDQIAIEEAVQTASLASGAEVLPLDRSPLAVSVSRKPAERPRGLERKAAAASTAASAAAPEQDTSASTAEPAPEADAEPESDGPMPSLPTSASVAKQATVKDAVNLSQLTLIGIYGSESRRYALVRQPNGRLIKVKVGDRLDGGKVAAISTSELTYQKSGRAVTLEMPRT